MTTKLEQAARHALEAMIAGNDEWPRLDVTEAITALREALAEQADMNLNCKSVQARLATLWGYVKAEQAEQEPVGEMIDKAGYKGAAWYLEPPATGIKLYAAPVRTKDLTDDEIVEAVGVLNGFDAFRAAIAADREKNK